MDFKKYLEKQQFSSKTIDSYLRSYDKFSHWLNDEGLKITDVSYNNLLTFIRHSNALGQSKRYVNFQLTVIRHYFAYLIKIGKVKDNVAANLFVKGVSRRLPHNLLNEETLIAIYENYPTNGFVGKRNKVILGLMVYQGLSTEELAKIEVEHIKLKEGKVYVPGGKRVNSRILPLAAHQVMELNDYIVKVRPLLLEFSEKQCDKLFTSIGKGERFNNIMANLLRNVQAYIPNLNSLKQIRMSVITFWLEKFNIREVQYMAGHRYVSSTERYMLTNLDDLQNDLNEYHPL